MKIIGFRASPKELNYAIISGSPGDYSLVCTEGIIVPMSLNFPERLNYVRKTVKDIMEEYEITRAGIRTTESSSPSLNIERISFEAVLLELLSSSTIEKYFQGEISSMTSRLGLKRTEFKPLIDNKVSKYKELVLSPYSKQEREAILVAIATLNM